MIVKDGSYNISSFALDARREIQRLNAQVDLFWDQELPLMESAGLRDGMHILDCGCGPGHLLKRLSVRFPSLRCTGIDVDESLLEFARQAHAGCGNSRFTRGSVCQIEAADDSFDFVISRLVLEHLPDPETALREIRRVLKPGGMALFIDNDFDFHERTWPACPDLENLYSAYCKARITDGGDPCIGRRLPGLVADAGFVDIQFRSITAHSYLVGDAAFLKAEGAGIPAQLVNKGYLAPEVLDRLAAQWQAMLQSSDHAIMRTLFAVSAAKPSLEIVESSPGHISHRIASEIVTRSSPDLQPIHSRESVLNYLLGFVATEMETEPEMLDISTSLVENGLDSIGAVGFAAKTKQTFGVEISISDILCGKTLEQLTDKVLSLLSSAVPGGSNSIKTQPRWSP